MTTQAPARRASWHDAYDAQMALWRWYRTDVGMDILARSYTAEAAELHSDTRELQRTLYNNEWSRLIDLDPIYVSAEMCEVVNAAKDEFKPEPLLDTDLITPRGFLFYETPFVVPDRFDEPVTIAAVSWARMFAVSVENGDEIETLKREVADATSGMTTEAAEEEAIRRGVNPNGIALTLYAVTPGEHPAGSMPPVVPFHVTPWYFDMTFEGNEIDENGKPTGAGWWWRVVQTTFRLMAQKISTKHLERADRSTRREAARLKFPDETDIVVVRLRREAGERHEPSGEGANYSHRFIVSGHWRNQWYPSIDDHRQIWISPYVKGDAGLPLIVRPRRVYQWSR